MSDLFWVVANPNVEGGVEVTRNQPHPDHYLAGPYSEFSDAIENKREIIALGRRRRGFLVDMLLMLFAGVGLFIAWRFLGE
jgi:hypothetical protein